MDREHVGTQEGQVGPVESKLVGFGRLRGLVFGAWGEASAGVHALVEELAERRAGSMAGGSHGRRSKVKCPLGAKGVAVGQLRRALSVVAVRAQARLLLDRVCWVGKGAAQAAKRRAAAEWEVEQFDRRRRREEAAARGHRAGPRPGCFNFEH